MTTIFTTETLSKSSGIPENFGKGTCCPSPYHADDTHLDMGRYVVVGHIVLIQAARSVFSCQVLNRVASKKTSIVKRSQN